MQSWVVIFWALLALVCADDCPDGGECKDGHTCCNTPASGYGCCPLDQAECCGDHVHCCPEGTICDVARSGCVNASASVPWLERVPANQPRLSKSFRMIKTYTGEEEDNVCPDQSICPPEFSCQRALTRFGCCPLAQAIPCSDGKHCCPEGHRCSADSRSCLEKELVSAVRCSDGVSECPEETTCCETPDGSWGCCPMPQAVCCDDKTHCCPKGSTCDVAQSKCISSSTQKETPMWAKFPARKRAEWENQNGNDVACNDTVACEDGTTCCKTKEGDWACCPLPQAVCCDDFIHCCPHGQKCNVAAMTCDDGLNSLPWLEKVPTIPRKGVKAGDVACDATHSCADGTTCCKTATGDWACCPLPEAVCCDDLIHCCPHGKKCNEAAGTCDDGPNSLPWLEKVPTIRRKGVEAGDVACDATHNCADGTTCCKTATGDWACCPLPEAVCCDDLIHCCPHGKKCNVAAGTCDDGLNSLPWLEKVPTIPRKGVEAGDVACDATHSCADGTTCCKTATGEWACCPLPKAVCCDDHVHCCPTGTTCDPSSLSCNGPSQSAPMLKKLPAFTTLPPTEVAATTESQVATTVRVEQQEEEEEEQEEEEEDEGRIQCDPDTTCPEHTTCCFMTSVKKWGCCPLPKAVCCPDGNHCCPIGYTCDGNTTSCHKEEVVIPWYNKLPAESSIQAEPSSVQCDAQNRCPEHSTCCQLFTGQWGCCPLQKAVCCPDQKHCCPQGYSCNMDSGSCQKLIMLQLQRVPFTPVYVPKSQPQPYDSKHGAVKCDDQFSCSDGETCCKTSSTTWGCCPSPNAVCCSDMKHCCPAGYTCGAGGSCSQTIGLRWDNWQEFHDNKKRALVL
ncbi:granulin a [Diretmus argenteus]